MRKLRGTPSIRIAVDAIGADFRHQRRRSFRRKLRGSARVPMVPRHGRGRGRGRRDGGNSATILLERRRGRPACREAGRTGCGCRCRYWDRRARAARCRCRRNAVEVIEKAVDGVLAAGRIVKVAVFHHRLRLDEGALGPLELGARVDFTRESGAYAALGAVSRDFGEPVGGGFLGGRAGDLLAVGRISGVLCESGEGEQADRDEPLPDAIRIQ